ncbi:MAG: NAD-dependent epimerase/dehydratase family protein [Thermoflexales bacterium]
MVTIVISGASGFLGSHLTRRFAREGHRVIALVRARSSLRRLRDVLDLIHTAPADGDGLGSVLRAHAPVAAVIHTATHYGRAGSSWVELVETNMCWSMRLAEAAVEAQAGCFLNAGSALPPEVSPYALSKFQFSQWLEWLAQRAPVQFVDVKLETMYGEDDNPEQFIPYLILNCMKHTERIALTSGEQRRDFIYIQDVVAAFARLVAFHGPEQGRQPSGTLVTYAVGSGVAVPVRQVAELIRALTYSRSALDFGAKPQRPHEVMWSQADLSAMRALNWSPQVDLQEGLQRTIAWWQKHLEEEARCAG